MESPIRVKFFAEDSSIDRDGITVLHPEGASSGWLLSSPRTTTFSKMQLKPSQDSTSPYSHSPASMREFERRTVACRQTSKELQHRFSISSDSSNPGLTDDPFASPSPNSDTSFEDIYNCNPSAVDLESEEIWQQYFKSQSPIKATLLNSPLYHDFPPALPSYASSETQLLSRSRSPINPDTFSPYPGDLHRSDAVRSSRDRSRTIQIPRTQPSYSAFPIAPPEHQPAEIHHPSHQSWPQRNESRSQQPARSRAYTAPSQARVIRPSNLNVCTSINHDVHYVSSTSNRFHSTRSAPPTPLIFPVLQPTDIVEQFVSHFDEDDDEEHKSVFGSFASRLYSSGSWGKKSGLEKRKKNPRKSLSEFRDALKGCFGKNK